MSDPFIRAKRPTLGSQRPSTTGKAAGQGATPSDAQVAEAYLKSSGPTGTREKLNNFLSKLETTWKLFNRSSTDSADGELPESRLALLDDAETPTPETLKQLRARFKQSARKPAKSSQSSLYRSASPEKKAGQQQAKTDQGPKQSPASDRNTPKPPTSRPQAQAQAQTKPEAQSKPQPQPKPQAEAKPQNQSKPQAQPQASPPPQPKPQAQSKPQSQAPRPQSQPNQQPQKQPGPDEDRKHMERPRENESQRPSSRSSTGRGSVLGRRPGSTSPQQKSTFTAPKQQQQAPKSQKAPAEQPRSQGQAPAQGQPRPAARKGPTFVRRPGTPRGQATSKSFLGSSQSSSQMRSSDAAGRPGRAAETHVARQPVFSQSVAMVSPSLKKRQVNTTMPVHNSFLDECHEESSKESGPIRLNWNSGKKVSRSVAQRMFANRRRLQLSRRGQGGGQSLGNPINLSNSSKASLAAARTDVSTRIAGAAIGSLLDDLYEEEEVENLDEETAVTSLGLILRLGGEFTYKHSTRVLDLALELADQVGIRDKQTRKEIKFGTMLRDVGEFDMLLQASGDSDRLSEFSSFLQGQDMLRAGLLHDIGKVKIPPEILYKPGKLTAEEYELMKMHPIWGEEIVRPIASLRYLCPTIRGHHERWDGKGYPDGLEGEKIPLAARIISVADVFDALAAERPYKRGMEVSKVIAILSEGRGSHFDPFLVDAFLEVLRRRYPE